MSNDKHDIDSIFNSAYGQFREEPSANTWEKINSDLDQKDAKIYRKRSTFWKRTSLLLVLIFAAFILYETRIVEKGSARPTVAVSTPKIAPGGGRDQKRTQQNDATTKVERGDKNEHLGSSHFAKSLQQHRRYLLGRPSDSNTIDNRPANAEQKLLRREVFAGFTEPVGIDIFQPSVNSVEAKCMDIVHFSEQETSQKIVPGKYNYRWSLMAYASTDYANYWIDNDSPITMRIKQHEEHEPSFSMGVLLGRQLNRVLSLQTGLIYSMTRIAISPQEIYALQDQSGAVSYEYLTSSGYAYIKPAFDPQPSPGDSIGAENAQHSLQNVIVPLSIQFKLIKHNKFSFSPGLGIAGNFLTSAKVETEVEDAFHREHVLINKLNGIKSFYWSVLADAEIDYNPGKKMSLTLHPSLRYALSAITNINDIETFPYSVGIGVGIKYQF